MFKKIHSNRDPDTTIFSAVKKEFAPYFCKAGTCTKVFAERHPKFLLGVMIFSMTLSIALSFTVFQPKPAPPKLYKPVSGGFDQLLQTAVALKETIRLQRRIDSLSAKKTLTAQDSAGLGQALDELQKMNKNLKK